MKSILFFITLIFLSPALAQQRPVFAIYKSDDFPTDFIDSEGHLLFTLPEGDVPITNYPKEWSNYLGEYDEREISVFTDNICPVRSREGNFYWINSQGTTIQTFEKQYSKMSKMMDGFVVAWETPIENSYQKRMVYLDRNGNNNFHQNYWQAGPFSEGLAVVQPNENGPWYIIDKNGKELVNLEKTLGDVKVSLVDSFHDGLLKIYVKKNVNGKDVYFWYFLNKAGQVAIDISKAFGDHMAQVGNFQDGYAGVLFVKKKAGSSINELGFIDKQGDLKFKLDSVYEYMPFSHGLAYITFIAPTQDTTIDALNLKDKWIDKQGKEVHFKINKSFSIAAFPGDIHDNNVHLQGIQRKPASLIDLLFSIDNRKLIYRTTWRIIGHYQDLVLVRDRTTLTDRLIRIPGKQVWETPAEKIMFTNIKAALKIKDRVRYFKVMTNIFPESILQLKNLEYLELSSNKITDVPMTISQLDHLKSLSISNLHDLTSLPSSIVKLPHLEHLKISGCEKLTGVESIIERSGNNLKRIELDNYQIAEWFINKMKRIRPDLTISATYSGEINSEF